MPAGMGSAVVLMAINLGCTCLSLSTYALISPLEPQNSLVAALLLAGWVWARLRGVDADLLQTNSGLVDEGRLGGWLSGLLLTSP